MQPPSPLVGCGSAALSFRGAAAETFTAQSVLSAHVMRLEELLGVKLLERDRRRVLLTADGAKAQQHAQRVLARWTCWWGRPAAMAMCCRGRCAWG